MRTVLIILTGLIITVSCSSQKPGQERASALAAASLKMVRLEQQTLARGTDPASALGKAEGLFMKAVKLKPQTVRDYVKTGMGSGKDLMESFLETVYGLDAAQSEDDPAAAVMGVFSEAPETKGRSRGLIAGYAAAFQMSMELERDGTLMQDFIPFLLALGCPMTFHDLGLERADRARLEQLAALASGRTGKRNYDTGPFDYFITMVKLDSWSSKFSGQVTADTLAARLMSTPEFKELIPRLKNLPAARLGFLGDSNMDRIHWSTQAPFPDIIAAVFRKLNPKVTVTNAGKGGDDSGEALARIDEDLIAKSPGISFVMLGGNDCRHWGRPNPAVTPEQYRKNITEITRRLRQSGSRVVLLSYPRCPSLSGADLEVFQGINRELKAASGSLETGWIESGAVIAAQDQQEVYAVDSIHLSPEGHLLVAKNILTYLIN